MIQFDGPHIFQMGWFNRQLETFICRWHPGLGGVDPTYEFMNLKLNRSWIGPSCSTIVSGRPSASQQIWHSPEKKLPPSLWLLWLGFRSIPSTGPGSCSKSRGPWAWATCVFLWTNIWLNYGDLTRPHPKRWFSKGIPRLFQKNLGWWNIIPFAQRNMCFDMTFGVLCVLLYLFFFGGVLWGWEKNWMGMHLYSQGIPFISKYINLEPNLTFSPPAFHGLPIFQGHLGSRNVCIYIYLYHKMHI